MADDDEKFPEFMPAKLINPVLIEQSMSPATQWGYIQSASRELVAFLKALKCKRCVEMTKIDKDESRETRFTSSDPPYILNCGHYVHYNCRYINQNKNKLQFSCKRCSKRDIPIRFNGKLWDRPVFKGFYEAIAEKGYPCIGCKTLHYHGHNYSAFHPKNNVVRVLGDDRHKMEGLVYYRTNPTYLCVWCARRADYRRYYLRLLRTDDEQEADFSKGDLRQLNSVDCTLHCSQFPNLQCCHCMRPVISAPATTIPIDRGWNYRNPTREGAEHLPCGHLRCMGCKEEEGEQVYCNLCDERNRWLNPDIEGTVSRFSKDITSKEYKIYVEKVETNIDYEMIRCFKCKAYHPRTNGSQLKEHEYLCLWCKVQGKLKKRKGKWYTREVNKRGRDHEKGQDGRSKSLSKSEDRERGRKQEKGQERRWRSKSSKLSKEKSSEKKLLMEDYSD